uniref:Protein kinase domain-containing protein n=1 Tax=Fagus sylvatica TaxID=28930 RepID=A0A2N9H449_FAGSY
MCYGRNAQATLAIGSWHKVLLPLILLWATKAVVVVNALPLKDCDDQCGNVTIPYPFGTREGCYMNETFLITCNRTYNPPLAFMGKNYTTGCTALCDDEKDVVEGSCFGIGCCQTIIPKGVVDLQYQCHVFQRTTQAVWDFNPCSYAFVVEEGAYNFSKQDLRDFRNRTIKTPVVLNWAIGDQNCSEAKKDLQNYACTSKDNRTVCLDSDNGKGYYCSCSKGFEGNPYLPDGCQDIDECQNATLSLCAQKCTNYNGTYECSCEPGYEGDAKSDGTGCRRKPSTLIVRVALGKGKLMKLKEKFFEENGGFLLQQQLSRHNRSVETTQIFTAEELKKATNNYHENRILGQGGQGTVYKGILPDNRIVAIKKSKILDQSQVEQFINEVSVLSQVNHRNVVKLLGCCLETQVPLLVYEFVTNGTLFEHIHNASHTSMLPWPSLLQIAVETAGALSYLHSAASTPIIHRDIKSTNILLDDKYTAKVSDFGASRLIPLDQTFGVLLAELLTGKKAFSFDRPEEERNLAMYFVSSMNENHLFEIIDQQVLNEGNAEQLKEIAMLTKRCLGLKGDERPTMKEVAMELEGLKAMETHSWMKGNMGSEETENLLGKPYDACFGGANSDSACYDSINDQVIISGLDDGR